MNGVRNKTKGSMFIGSLALLLIFGIQLEEALGEIFKVTKTADTDDGSCDSDCSLREAINAANTSELLTNTIILPEGTYFLTRGGLEIIGSGPVRTRSVIIEGENPKTTIIDGRGVFRVLSVEGLFSDVEAEITNVTIQNGRGSSLTPAGATGGGGILNGERGSLFLDKVVISNNKAQDGAGIVNFGFLSIRRSTVSNNISSGRGFNATGGGGILNGIVNQQLIITDSFVSIEQSTISNNMAEKQGGGIANFGTLEIVNGTISGNTVGPIPPNSTPSGFIIGGGGISNRGVRATLFNVTIAKNNTRFSKGGGIFGDAVISNTIIGDNNMGFDDCAATLTSMGFNLIQNTSGCTISGDTTGNILGRNPQLAALKNNGGPTETHELLVWTSPSPAIDAGNPISIFCGPIDQRGFLRPADGPDADDTATCDIGAFELRAVMPPVINNRVTFVPDKSTFKTSSDTTGCPAGFVGKFSFMATLTNTSILFLFDLMIKVTALTNGNLLENGDSGPGAVGATLTVPIRDLPGRGRSTDVPFIICLKEKKKFSFFVDVLGIVQ